MMFNPLAQNEKTITLTFAKSTGLKMRIRATLSNPDDGIVIEVVGVELFSPKTGSRELIMVDGEPSGRFVDDLAIGNYAEVSNV